MFDSGKWKKMEKVKDDVGQLVNLYERYKLLDNQVCQHNKQAQSCAADRTAILNKTKKCTALFFMLAFHGIC